MKIRSERDKRTYLIIALCTILVVMGAGYAAFSSLLTINGTANISNSWCVGFDNTKTSDMQVTKGVSTGTQPTGSMSYSGTACGTNLVPTSSLVAHFYQPGDEIEYTLTITNKSTVSAAIKSILVDNESVTSNTTKKKGNITYVVEMPADTTLDVNESTTMKVIAKFQNETDVTGNVNGETQSIEVKINAEQDDGNGGFTPAPTTFTGTIYRNNTNKVAIGSDMVGGEAHRYCVQNVNGKFDCYFLSLSECESYASGLSVTSTCVEDVVQSDGVGNYVTNPDDFINNGVKVFLKHEIENNVVKTHETCYYTSGNMYCIPERGIRNSYEVVQNSFDNCSEGMGNISCWDDYVNLDYPGVGNITSRDIVTNNNCYIYGRENTGFSQCLVVNY